MSTDSAADPSSHWRCKLFYHNKNDPRAFVPKKGRVDYLRGATINFATTEGKLFMAATVGCLVWAIAGTVRDSRAGPAAPQQA
jgi:uncharacterized membrane protein